LTLSSTRSLVVAVLAASLLVLPVPATAQAPPPSPAPPAPGQPSPAPPAPPAPEPRRVAALEVRGNRHIAAERILAVVTNTRPGAPFSEEALRGDIRAVSELGFFADVTARTTVEADGVHVVIVVTENPLLAEVVVEGATVIPTEEILRTLGVPSGEVLNIVRLREGTRAVQKLYEDRGYVLARVVDTVLIPLEAAPDQARLRVRIAEGTVEAVRFEGLRRTRERTVRRHIQETVVGRVFNTAALNRDLQRLFDTGLFESIRARPEPGRDPDSVIVTIEVTEARTAQIGGGVGYSSEEGIIGFVEYRDRNYRGLGQSFAVTAERSVQTVQPVTNYQVRFSDPFFGSLASALDLALFSQSSVEFEYSGATVVSRFALQRSGSTFTLSRNLDPITAGSLRLKSELTDIVPLPLSATDPASPVVPPSLLTPGRVVSLLLSGTRDSRDDRLRPTRGTRLALSAEFGLRPLGSDFAFSKYVADVQGVVPVRGSAVLVGHLMGGAAAGLLPVQEQFVLGGPGTVRSYTSGRFRADSIVVANLEFRFSLGTIIKSLGDLQGILFVDAGNAPAQLTDLKTGYGFGVAVNTPVGPIRIDFAFGPEGRQTWFSLGAPF
jgi:outer membrane protein insertion porin family